MMRDDYCWKSDMATMLQRFIAEKRMAGFKYLTQERVLQRFDEFFYLNGYSGIRLTKSMTDAFIYNEIEKPCTHYKKEIVMKDFGGFLNNNGYHTYIPVVKSAPIKRCNHNPFIFTQEQLKTLFTTIDFYPIEKANNRNTLDPVLFRLLYGSGLRISEALNLKLKNVDTENGILTILHAKNNKDRLVLYLLIQKNVSEHTIASYRDTFKLLLTFCETEMNFSPNKMSMKHFNKPLVLAFLDWLEKKRSCSIST